jgi:hypothetical protein
MSPLATMLAAAAPAPAAAVPSRGIPGQGALAPPAASALGCVPPAGHGPPPPATAAAAAQALAATPVPLLGPADDGAFDLDISLDDLLQDLGVAGAASAAAPAADAALGGEGAGEGDCARSAAVAATAGLSASACGLGGCDDEWADDGLLLAISRDGSFSDLLVDLR